MNNDNNIDDWVDARLIELLDINNPKSFFMFAGAGSGKTRSLVNALKAIGEKHNEYLKLRNKQIAVITYTNAASDEIVERLRNEAIDVSLFEVSTIHSFAWTVIQSFTEDIKLWLTDHLKDKISKIEEKERKGRKGTDASAKRIADIERARKQLEGLNEIIKFRYDPLGENREKNALQHSEVTSICADFIKEKPLFQQIISQKYPIILIDESQDTEKALIHSFFELEEKIEHFALGLFGDMMQRIYSAGEENLDRKIPSYWDKPEKLMNHRSQKRIVELINAIRKPIDKINQQHRIEKDKGIVRLFVFDSTEDNKDEIEQSVKQKMSAITNDELWLSEEKNSVKTLILEHHMAASRLGFYTLYNSLNSVSRYRAGLRDGTLSPLNFFTNLIPLVEAHNNKDKLTISRIINEVSPILETNVIEGYEGDQIELLRRANTKVNSLFELWENESPLLKDILLNIYTSNLLTIPEPLKHIANLLIYKQITPLSDKDDRRILHTWLTALDCRFEEVENYHNYISDESQFATHQGVKGLEYDRVIGVIDDKSVRGTLFSYEELFGVKELSAKDKENKDEGKDTSIDRVTRLLYVICSRAKESLALVAYTEDPDKLISMAISKGWFTEKEILTKFEI